ncbi:type I glutamate--ammonia ligase [Bacilliculturomica massiliensis]|uniref:glutamine synthetase n=1 Tax=Bacilliculturomica massiliensis TaxID=1917867 RepID=UPI001031F451|nr:glutamine synthetase [Bacilliculturomica massiliensis]
MLEKMLFNIPKELHTVSEVYKILGKHPEVKFVSLVGIDIGGHDTDEKIPVKMFMADMEKFLTQGVQTDGSSVVLPRIAQLNNAKVDIIPDMDVNWYVDYNLNNRDEETGLPLGTLRIPSFLVHNDTAEVGSRVILRDAVKAFKAGLMKLMREHPYVFRYLPVDSVDEIDEILLTSATELEFWVKTPEDKGDSEQLSTSQVLKEQYWKRTIGPVRTALEKSLIMLDQYGFEVEMGHKEVGGVKAKLGSSGNYDHIMEQLEIDWKYSDAIQAADNENQVKYVVKDVFRAHGLDVTFMAKPIRGVAGSGEHTHMGVAARLKNGRVVSLFAPLDREKDFLSPIGFGALMGILKNYEIMNPFVTSTNDALNRLKPGFEAPVCIVTSLGHSAQMPSRNRTVLVGLVRDINNPLSTRFELRSPNPKSNTYLVIASGFMCMLDGIKAALENGKTPEELEASISKREGQRDFYLEKDREYRTERDVFEEFTQEERDRLFGRAPATVWENIRAFDLYPEKLEVLMREGVMDRLSLESYKHAIIAQWATELHNRIIPETMNFVRDCRKRHNPEECADLDDLMWSKISKMRRELAQDTINEKSLLSRVKDALDEEEFEKASELQLLAQQKIAELGLMYSQYKKNLF